MRVSILAMLLASRVVYAALARPHIVVIVSDDAGYADWEFMDDYLESVNAGQTGSPVPTPRLNSLRERGVLFTSAYTAAVCSPSRAAIVTGSYPQRIGYEYNINNLTGATAVDGLDPGTTTIFHRMKAEGYTTGVIGKWHLGARANDFGLGNRPENMAVDEFLGIWKGSRSYTVGGATGTAALRETIRDPFSDTVLESTPPWNTTYNYVTSAFGKGAIDFVGRHYNDPVPFFLYVAFTCPHAPIGDSPAINDPRIASLSGSRKQYASMVLSMDMEIGNILDKIDDPAGDGSVSLTDNTLIVFINDNGGASGNGTVNTPLRNWKGSTYEGGTRVPMIIAGPGVPFDPAVPIVYDRPVHSIDILPTCLAAAGGGPLVDGDGVNLLPFLTGDDNGDPHGIITIRNGSKVGVRKGNWKLTKNASNVPFELYDLAGDVSETTNRAGAHPAVVDALLRDLTAFEAGADKPRHAGLNDSADSINLNDHFRFNPVSSNGTPTATGPNVVRNPGFESGTQADGNARFTFAELDDWSNDGVEDTDVGAIDNDPHAGVYRGVFVATERIPYQLTDHTIIGRETMLLDFWHKGKSGWDNGDTIDVDLFYLDGGGAVQVVLSANFNPTPDGWSRSVHLFAAISDPAAVGKTLGIRFRSNAGGSEFVSIDDIRLSTGTNAEGGDVVTYWSAAKNWIDTDTGASDTLLSLDAFPGAILEFPVVDSFNYTAFNDMTRMTDLEFMLNQLRLSGTFDGAVPRLATLTGNSILFTDDLSGNPPAIDVSAGGTNVEFVIANELILYDDLSITGNGDATVRIAGTIRDYSLPCGIAKSGASSVLLTGTHSYSGLTSVSEGMLLLDAGASLTCTSVTVGPNGRLGGSGTVGGDVTSVGTLAPGLPVGALSIGGNAALTSLIIEADGATNDFLAVGGVLDLTDASLAMVGLGLGFTESAYILSSYGVLTGPFNTVVGLPAGYWVDYAYNDGLSARNIAVVTNSFPTRYASWIGDSELTDPDMDFTADPNHDGTANGLAFFLGAADPLEPATICLPKAMVTGGNPVFFFDRADEAVGLKFRVEYCGDLAIANWTPAQHGVGGVVVRITDKGATDQVSVSLPLSLAEGGSHLFARLCVTGTVTK